MTAVMIKEWQRLLRLPGTPWALLAYLLLPLLVAAVHLKALDGAAGVMPQLMPMFGAQSLTTLATWQLLLLAVIAPWAGAGLVAEEMEERTLGLLVAGGRSLLGLLAAKLTAAVLFLALFVLAGLPVYAVPFTVGGVNWAMLGRVAALQGATLLMMTGIGLVCSTWGRRVGGAALAGVAFGLLVTLGTGLAANMSPSGGPADAYVMMLKSSMPTAMPVAESLPKWLYGNPLVGLNSALNSGAGQGLVLPGSGSGPVYKQYQLWQVQLAGGPAAAVLGLVVAWVSLWLRMRWRWPMKGVAANAAR